MKALVLAAGLGTRLRPVTLTRAKPSLPVLGIPSLWYGAWHIKNSLKINDFALNFSHAPATLEAAAKDSTLVSSTGIVFHLSDETKQILGSSGALHKLKDWIKRDTLLVCNADSICFLNWQKLVDFHNKNKALLTMHVRSFKSDSEMYTNITCAANGQVIRLADKSSSGTMFSGSYVFAPELLDRLPQGVSELRPSILEPLVAEKKLFAYQEDIEWIDTGTLSTYFNAQFQAMDLSIARPLVELKMKEHSDRVWLPKTWKTDLSFQTDVVLTGNQDDWEKLSNQYGPRFVGVEVTRSVVKPPMSNALMFSDHFQRF